MAKRGFLIAILMVGVRVLLAGESPTAEELIARCGANYDKLQSWIMKSTQSIESHSSWGKAKTTHAYDIRFGGNRVSVRWREWGDVPGFKEPVAEEKASYRSMSWYDGRYINYGRAGDGNDLGSGVIDPNARERDIRALQHANPCSCLTGFCPLGTDDRIDAMLRHAFSISIRNRRESVNGIECYVVDANIVSGNCAVWIDPEHGYSVAQVHLKTGRGGEYLQKDQPMGAQEATFTLRAACFENIDGAWLAREADWTSNLVYPGGDYSEEKRHIVLNEVILNPDHEALKSLVPDDVRNGANIWVPPAVQIRHTWQDGKLLTRIDEKVVAEMDKILENILARKEGDLDANEPAIAPMNDTAGESAQKPHRTHCGLYCIYSALRIRGQKLDFRELVKPEYYGSHGGSSLAELRQAAVDYGLQAEVALRVSTRALRNCPYMAILHVKPNSEAREYNHYELFMGTEDGMARMFNPPEAPRLVSFGELAAQWDGAGLLLSPYRLKVDAVLTADRQRLLLYGTIGVLTIVLLHVARFVWRGLVGTISRRGTIRLTLAQSAGIGLVALTFAIVYHLANDEALLANAKATASVQKAYAGSFISRISIGQMRKLLATDMVLIDARLRSDYERGHFNGAISLPVDANDTVWKVRTASIPRGKRIVVYCQSAGCKFAESVSVRLMEGGFKGISIYRGGWNEWVARNPDAADKRKTPVRLGQQPQMESQKGTETTETSVPE